jgi:hypothetical protein
MAKKITDFNDLAATEGLDTVSTTIHSALMKGVVSPAQKNEDSAAADNSSGVTSIEAETQARKSWEERIENCGDFDEAVYRLYPAIAETNLREPTKEFLGKRIAKKYQISLAVLKSGVAKISPRKHSDERDDYAERIAELNEKHAVVPVGGGVYIVNHDYDPMLQRPLLTLSNQQAFELRYRNLKVVSNNESVGLGSYWLDHPDRRQYDGLVFSPDQEVKGYMNLWRGWGVEPVEGECGRWLSFVKEVICHGDEELFAYVIFYFAHLVQKPRELPETALVLRGEEGIGKNTFFAMIGEIVGRAHYMMLNSMQQIAGRFSGHLADVLFVVCNEGVWGGNKDAQGILKSMITDDFQPMEKKGLDITSIRNFKRVLFSTNENWAVPRGMDDRRHVICDVSNARKGDLTYWAELRDEFNKGAASALYYKLLQLDLKNWHPRQVPKRLKEAGYEMKILSAGTIARWWMDRLMHGWLIKDGHAYAEEQPYFWPQYTSMELIKNSYLTWCDEYKITHREHVVMIGKELKLFGVTLGRPRQNNPEYRRLYKIPELKEAQAIFSEKFSIPLWVWDSGDDEDETLIN